WRSLRRTLSGARHIRSFRASARRQDRGRSGHRHRLIAIFSSCNGRRLRAAAEVFRSAIRNVHPLKRFARDHTADTSFGHSGNMADGGDTGERLAGAPGFEPVNGGTKNRCLTAWLRPNMSRVGCDDGPYTDSVVPKQRVIGVRSLRRRNIRLFFVNSDIGDIALILKAFALARALGA